MGTFFSPCHAGCLENKDSDSSLKLYKSCSCVNNDLQGIENLFRNQKLWWANVDKSTTKLGSNNVAELSNVAIEGYCPSTCQQQFFLLVIVGIILGSMAATGLLPSTLINMRAIRRMDKSASITLSVSALSAFAILPSPLIFGAIFDSSCTIWGEKCGEQLNCLVYDTEQLRTSISLLMASLFALALIGNFAVWYHVKDLKIYG